MNLNYVIEWTDHLGHHVRVCDSVKELQECVCLIPNDATYDCWCMNNKSDPLGNGVLV